jgi:hypothetical protein
MGHLPAAGGVATNPRALSLVPPPVVAGGSGAGEEGWIAGAPAATREGGGVRGASQIELQPTKEEGHTTHREQTWWRGVTELQLVEGAANKAKHHERVRQRRKIVCQHQRKMHDSKTVAGKSEQPNYVEKDGKMKQKSSPKQAIQRAWGFTVREREREINRE